MFRWVRGAGTGEAWVLVISDAEELLGMADPGDEGVYLRGGVVEVERGAGARLDAKRPVQRPGAVMARTHRDTAVVEYLAEVVGVDAVQFERDGAAPVLGGRRTEDAKSLDVSQRRQGLAEQLLLVRPDGVRPHLGEVVDRRAKADRLRDRHRAGLELVRRRRERRPVHPDALDHLAATEERRHLLEQGAPRPQHADPGGTAHLVTGEA